MENTGIDNYETVLRTPDLGPGSLTEVQAHGRTLALANVGQTYYALDGVCPADGARLGEGRLEGDHLICPRDHAFDVRNGEAAEGDGSALTRYAIRITGNEIQVGPPLEASS